MPQLLVGFDSAWTATNEGAIVAAVRHETGDVEELGPPRSTSFPAAAEQVLVWHSAHKPSSVLILLDQPTIVRNARGQRPVESVVSSPVGRRRSAVQPANTSRTEMFGKGAPLWPFLERFGGAADPFAPNGAIRVIETYPVLALAALGWLQSDERETGRLPKYNPERRRTFSLEDWKFVCERLASALDACGLSQAGAWADLASRISAPRKRDQDALDACLCLLVALHFAEGRECVMVGNLETGYMVVPYGAGLYAELETRCRETGRDPDVWVRVLRGSQIDPGDLTS